MPPSRQEHVRHDEPRQEERRSEIDADRLLNPLGRQFFVMGKSLDPRVVDEDVDCSPFADCRLDKSCEIVALSDVGRNCYHFDTHCAELHCGLFEPFRMTGGDHEVRPGRRQMPCDCQTDPGRVRR